MTTDTTLSSQGSGSSVTLQLRPLPMSASSVVVGEVSAFHHHWFPSAYNYSPCVCVRDEGGRTSHGDVSSCAAFLLVVRNIHIDHLLLSIGITRIQAISIIFTVIQSGKGTHIFPSQSCPNFLSQFPSQIPSHRHQSPNRFDCFQFTAFPSIQM